MGTTLTGTTPQDTYDSLIKVTDNGPLTGSLKKLTDGLGNDSSLSLSTAAASLSGTLAVTGATQIDNELVLTTNNAAFRLYRTTGTCFFDWSSGQDAAFSTVTSAGGAGRAEQMRITSAGNVGIGTSAPSTSLEVVKNDAVTNDSTNALDITHTSSGTTANGFGVGLGFNTENSIYSTINELGRIEVIETDQTTLNDAMVFYTRTNNVLTERARFLPTGGLTFNGDTAAANALDDYEEGTWTMGVSFGGASVGVTTSSNTGTYTKIGRKVTVIGFMQLTSKGSSTGIAAITGLPFTIATGNQFYSAPSLRYSGVTFVGQFTGFGDPSSTTIRLDQITEAGVNTNLNETNLANSSTFLVSFTYFV
jgi:hypothetical protein